MTLTERYVMATARVAGATHRRSAWPCQDGLHAEVWDGGLVAVVADGCGSSSHSEVGAQLGPKLWARALRDECTGAMGLDVSALIRARVSVTETLAALVSAMPGPREDMVRDFFLFTTVAVVLDHCRMIVFAIGDGIVAINGNYLELEPGSGNAPAYLGYELCEASRGLGDFSFIAVRPTPEIESLVLATDGASALVSEPGNALEALVADAAAYRNRDWLRRRLDQLATGERRIDWDRQRVVRACGPLADDAAIVAIRATSSMRACAPLAEVAR